MGASGDIENLRDKLKKNRKKRKRHYILSQSKKVLRISDNDSVYTHREQKIVDLKKLRTPMSNEEPKKATHAVDHARIKTIIKIIIYMVFLIVIGLLFYIITPLSTMTKVSISGNINLSAEEVYTLSEVRVGNKMYFINPEEVANTLVHSPVIDNAVVTKEGFNTLNIHITEEHTVAYLAQANGFYAIKSNGYMMLELVNIPFDGPIVYNFNSDNLDALVSALEALDEEIIRTISEIYARPSEANSNRIHLFMNDGQQVIADVTTLSEKISYYASIRSEIADDVDGLIDLEVGNSFLPYRSQEARELIASIYGESISEQERDNLENILEPLKAQLNDFSVQ